MMRTHGPKRETIPRRLGLGESASTGKRTRQAKDQRLLWRDISHVQEKRVGWKGELGVYTGQGPCGRRNKGEDGCSIVGTQSKCV
jgi:hypothetical protein